MKTLLAATLLVPVATHWMTTHANRVAVDPNTTIKKRLRAFIELAESVDFDAKVESQGNTTEFVRADYRTRSEEWKLLYRMGREPVLAARDQARTLLSELA